MAIENQVMVIYAATKGFMDEIPISHITRYQNDLLQEVENMHKGILDSIRDTKDLTKENTEKMEEVLKAFTERFKSTIN